MKIMNHYSGKRLFARKIGKKIQTILVSPLFSTPVLIYEISLGGVKIQWQEEEAPSLENNTRIRIMLPVGAPQQILILGGQVIWSTDTQCGIQIFYNNGTTLMYQKFLDQLPSS